MNTKCKVKECKTATKRGRSLCDNHYSRWRRNGSYDISPNWTVLKKGKPCLTKSGYFRVNINGKRVLQHRHIMEQHLERKLKPQETVHHINHDKTDNRIENLKLYKNNFEHIKESHAGSINKNRNNPLYDKNTIAELIHHLSKKPKPKICFCNKKAKVRGLCSKHYLWANRHNF